MHLVHNGTTTPGGTRRGLNLCQWSGMNWGGPIIATGMADEVKPLREGRLSLWFAPDTRPTADTIADCSARSDQASGQGTGFAISHRPVDHPYWLELLAFGLTYDLQGLQPGIPAVVDAPRHAYGLPLTALAGLEPVVLRPGPHLAAGGALLPVIRAMLGVGAELAGLPGLAAVGWEPADTVMSPDYFRKTVLAWLDGGAFPGLGLTAIRRRRGGPIESEGLAFFLGYEIALDPLPGESPPDATRYALRLIHDLVQNGPYSSLPANGPGGEALECEFIGNRTVLRVRRPATSG